MGRRQTSVLVSRRAVAALGSIAAEWGSSREGTARRLLAEHLETQAESHEDDRRTHISTVLRIPPPALPGQSDSRVRLPLRLDPGVDDRVVELAFRLPGQPRRQAHRDYAARPLADALVTAIASHTPFVDDELEGLPALLRWSEAIGLWRLAAAATRTSAEKEVLREGPAELRHELREGAVAWHAPWRSEMALHIARRLLTGSEDRVRKNLRLLGEQGPVLQHYEKELESIEVFGGHELTESAPVPTQSAAGRGGSAIWRARRVTARETLATWLTKSTNPVCAVRPPGWKLTHPTGWQPHQFLRTSPLPPSLQTYVAERRVLRIDHRGHSALWPLTAAGEPVPEFEHIIAGAGRVEPIELAEAVLVDNGLQEDVDEWAGGQLGRPWTSADEAHDLGFISTAERDALIQEASQSTAERIQQAITAATGRYHRLDKHEVDQLRAAAKDPQRFARLADEHHIRFWISLPTWSWDVDSVASALKMEATTAQLEWLGVAWLRLVRRHLERDMQQAWFRAFTNAHGHSDEWHDEDLDEDVSIDLVDALFESVLSFGSLPDDDATTTDRT